MKEVVLLIMVLSFTYSTAQETNYDDFKEGYFESLPPSNLETSKRVSIYRKGGVQIETDLETGEKTYEKIEWIANNAYILTFDENFMRLDNIMKYINNSGGMLVTITSREGDCFNYKAQLKNNLESPVLEATICKQHKE